MAHTSSAKKAQRVALRRRIFNLRRKSAMKDAAKEINRFIAVKKFSDTEATLPRLYQAIDKAAKHNTINKHAAARMKSRITRRLAALAT